MRYSAAEKLEIIQLVELNLNISSEININARARDGTGRTGIFGSSKRLGYEFHWVRMGSAWNIWIFQNTPKPL
jgi:hypothetical protein